MYTVRLGTALSTRQCGVIFISHQVDAVATGLKSVVTSTAFIRVLEANLKSRYQSAKEVRYRYAIMSALNELRDF